MINNLLTRVFGSRNERLLKQLQRSVTKINALEPEYQAFSDEQIIAKTRELQKRVQDGGESLDAVLPGHYDRVATAMAALSPQERETLAALLGKVSQGLSLLS